MRDAGAALAGCIQDRRHYLAVRVYFEDTDFSGLVYHASYLRFCERGRSDFLRLAGVHHHELAQDGQAFAVRRMEIDFRKGARIDDVLTVETALEQLGGASVDLAQKIWRGEELLLAAEVKAALIGPDRRPARLPQIMRARLAGYLPG